MLFAGEKQKNRKKVIRKKASSTEKTHSTPAESTATNRRFYLSKSSLYFDSFSKKQ